MKVSQTIIFNASIYYCFKFLYEKVLLVEFYIVLSIQLYLALTYNYCSLCNFSILLAPKTLFGGQLLVHFFG